MHEELLEYNADILAFLGVINDVDFRIMDKAENTINDSIAKYESMFDNFKQVLSSDVKRWRQENIDTKNNV
jgi:chloramphenicol O-acetyltransferase